MKKGITVLAAALIALSALGLAGCHKAPKGPPKVAFICKSYSDAFCVWVKDEMEKGAKANYSGQFELVCFDAVTKD